jgi:LDH2 family malate/lactate/ureidoglycolate dehydrogenase
MRQLRSALAGAEERVSALEAQLAEQSAQAASKGAGMHDFQLNWIVDLLMCSICVRHRVGHGDTGRCTCCAAACVAPVLGIQCFLGTLPFLCIVCVGTQDNGDLAAELAAKVAALEEAEKRVAKLQGQLAVGKQKFGEQVAKVKELKAALAAAQQQQVRQGLLLGRAGFHVGMGESIQ